MLSVGSVFSGIGLLDYGLHLAGLYHAWLCERDEWRRSILAKRFPGVRILDDVRHVGGHLPRIDVVAGGFPCKGASAAGRREGFGHPETVLWREMARAVRELRPRYVLVENVANILGLHDGAVWGEVVGDLAALGYGVVWDCLPAASVGAPHLRDRVFAVAAYADGDAGPQEHSGDDRIARERSAKRWRPVEPAGVGGLIAADGGRLPGAHASAWRSAAEDVGVAANPMCEGLEGRGPERERTRTRAVEWGEYQRAVDRWAAVHGPVPDPLVERVRGVDARHAARVERQRLSALGDGVQVQVGRIAGEYTMDLERGRLAA